MYQAVDVDAVQGNEEAEVGHAGDFAFEYFADFIAHVIGFQPVFHVAAGIVGAAFAERGVYAQSLPAFAWRVGLLVQHGFDGAVDGQVGIAADGGGEVSVCFVGKAEVSVAMRFVNCLLHGAQHHDLQQFGIGSAFELFGKRGIVFRRRVVAAVQLQTQ